MTETVFYRGPDGTVIDACRLQAALEDQGMVLRVERDTTHGVEELFRFEPRKLTDPGDDPCRVEVIFDSSPGRGRVLDAESFPARERIEGTARLLRRVLPDPSKVLSHVG